MSSSTYHPLPANESQLPLVSPSSTHHPARFDAHPSRSRLKFFVLRLILPLLSLLLLLALVIIPATVSTQFSFKQCQDGSCLKWDKVHDLAQNWGLGFQKPSPTAGPIRSKLKILHLVDRDTAEVLMDRWLLHSHGTSKDIFSRSSAVI
jgi:hypothetical protein